MTWTDLQSLALRFLEAALGWGVLYTAFGALVMWAVITFWDAVTDAIKGLPRLFRISRKISRARIERLRDLV